MSQSTEITLKTDDMSVTFTVYTRQPAHACGLTTPGESVEFEGEQAYIKARGFLHCLGLAQANVVTGVMMEHAFCVESYGHDQPLTLTVSLSD